jgi:hypothetical protein
MDQPWHSIFDNSMRQPWLYFCFRFDASVVNSLTMSIPWGMCHSVFIDDFKVYGYSVLAADLWISCDIAFLTIPWVGHDSIFSIDLMWRSWIYWRYRFHAVAVTQYSLTILRSTVTLFGRWFMEQPWDSVFDNSLRRPWLYFFYQFHASIVNSLTLLIPCGSCHSKFIDHFKVYRYFSFGRRFMDQPWQSVLFISMRRPWLYFFYRFDASVVNSLMLSIPCCSSHSVFIDEFKVYRYSLLAGDLWISRDKVFFSFPCVGHDSIFAIYLMLPSWIHWRCRFHAVPVTQYSLTISRSTVALFWPQIYGSAVT